MMHLFALVDESTANKQIDHFVKAGWLRYRQPLRKGCERYRQLIRLRQNSRSPRHRFLRALTLQQRQTTLRAR